MVNLSPRVGKIAKRRRGHAYFYSLVETRHEIRGCASAGVSRRSYTHRVDYGKVGKNCVDSRRNIANAFSDKRSSHECGLPSKHVTIVVGRIVSEFAKSALFNGERGVSAFDCLQAKISIAFHDYSFFGRVWLACQGNVHTGGVPLQANHQGEFFFARFW